MPDITPCSDHPEARHKLIIEEDIENETFVYKFECTECGRVSHSYSDKGKDGGYLTPIKVKIEYENGSDRVFTPNEIEER